MPFLCKLIELTPTEGYTYSAALGYLSAVCATDPVVGMKWDVNQEVYHLAPFDSRSVVRKVLSSMENGPVPEAIGFSISFWNRQASLECARALKAKWPETKIIFGGSDVSFQGEVLLIDNTPIDFIVNGEAELTMPELLQAVERKLPLHEVDGISYRLDGQIHNTPRRPLIANLDSIASPFLTGVVDPKPLRETTLLVYESNRGCPYACAYCFWGGATRTAIRCFSLERVAQELDFIMAHCRQHMVFFLADANFGILERDFELARLVVDACARHRKIITFSTNWTKKPRETTLKAAQLLRSAGLLGGVTVSVQTFDRAVMRKAKRTNISPSAYRDLLEELRKRDVGTYTDLIWGLPGQSYQTLLDDIDTCLDAGGCPVAYPLLLLPNTEFYSEEMREAYSMETELIPSDLATPALSGEMVVAHSTLSREEWRRGMRLIMGLNLFWKCLFRATITFLVKCLSFRYSKILDFLTESFFEEGLGDPVFRAILRDFEDTLSGAQPPRSERAISMVGESGLPEQAHFQALLKRFVYGQPGEVAVEILERSLKAFAPMANLERPLAIDLAARRTIQSTLKISEPNLVQIDPDLASVLMDANVLGLAEFSETTGLRVQSADVSQRFRFPAYALAIWHGGEHPLKDIQKPS